MLLSVRMRNFRKHEDREVTFTGGLNSIRGANEAGKTSMLLAITYALWGKKALPLTLEEIVTWGREVDSLSVGVTLRIEGINYDFERSESGAEVLVKGEVMVTGQTAVSEFASKLLGMSQAQSESIMFAPQSRMRGALESGPKEVAEYIESLSGMDLFEELLELASRHWITGPTKTIDTQIADLKTKVEGGEPKQPCYESIDNEIIEAGVDYSKVCDAVEEAQSALSKAQSAEAEASAKESFRAQQVTALKALKSALKEKLNLVESYKDDIEAAKGITKESILALTQSIEKAEGAAHLCDIHRKYLSLPSTNLQWEGDAASLDDEIERVSELVTGLQQHQSTIDGDIREANAKIVQGSVCGFCQQDYSQFPEVASRNAALLETIRSREAEKSSVKTKLAQFMGELKALKDIRTLSTSYSTFLSKYSEYVDVDEGFVPPAVKWKGEVPSDVPVDVAPMRRVLKDSEAKFKAMTQAALLAPVALADVNKLEVQVKEAEDNLPPEVDLSTLKAQTMKASNHLKVVKDEMTSLAEEVKQLQFKRERMKMDHEHAVVKFQSMKEELEKLETRREEQVFNNNLLKKIRAARPKVAARLWDIVLSAASQMFSSMRGEMSIITKTDKTFLVNGQSYLSLSGSALDLMGFAIRVAMQKTFVPHISFMLADEPTAACDVDRTAAMLGFIASAGFDQMILVTHSPLVDAVADNLVVI